MRRPSPKKKRRKLTPNTAKRKKSTTMKRVMTILTNYLRSPPCR